MLAKIIAAAALGLTLFVANASAVVPLFGAPAAPSNLVVTEDQFHRAVLTWKDNSTNESKFVIQRQKQFAGGGWGDLGKFWVGTNVTSFVNDAYPNQRPKTVRYRVRAGNAYSQYSGWTAWRQVTLH